VSRELMMGERGQGYGGMVYKVRVREGIEGLGLEG